jgi:hypothetical protein
MRPSLEQVTSKPCSLPSSVMAVSAMLSFFVLARYYGMLEAGRFGEEEERFSRGREKAWRHGQARACGSNVAKKFAAVGVEVIFYSWRQRVCVQRRGTLYT